MSTIDKIWSNQTGISFYWKQPPEVYQNKVQLVFKDIGFLLSLEELKQFASHCVLAKETGCCTNCQYAKNCPMLLRTPSDNIDVSVSSLELQDITELITTTIFKIEIRSRIEQGLN